MQLPVVAIRNFQFTLVLFLMMVMLGVVSFFTMPRSENPQFDFAISVVRIVSPGTNPLDIEKLIVDPVEDVINELEDLKNIRTEIEDGLTVLRVEFHQGVDPDKKYDDLVAAIARIRDDLPSSIVVLDVKKVSPADVGILQMALVSVNGQAGYEELKQFGEKLERRLERIRGVRRVDIDALPDLELQVQVDQRKINALGISLTEINQVIAAAGLNIPGGYVNSGERRFTVRTSGDFDSIEQVEDTVVKSHDGKFIYLRDVASIKMAETLPTYRGQYDGEKSIYVSVLQRKGTQIFTIMESLKSAIEEFKKNLPETMQLEIMMDQSISVEKQINGFFSSLNQGLILVAVLSFIVLGFKPSLVIVTAIPLSIFIAIGWVDLVGFGLQQMSIVGLVVALGLLVDNAIVVVENVTRHLRKGETPTQAAIKGSSQVAWAVISGTLTTVLSFLPMLLMQNNSATFMRSMPVTVVLTLFASLLISLTLVPLLASRLGSHKGNKNDRVKHSKMQIALDHFASHSYSHVLKWSLTRPFIVLGISIALLFASLSLFPMIGVSLFPKAEQPMLLVNIDMEEGASFERTEAVATALSAQVRQYKQVEHVALNVGRGNPRIFYNILPNRQAASYAQLFITMNVHQTEDVDPLIASIRQHVSTIAGAKITVKELMQGPGVEAPVTIRIVGDELGNIQQVAKDVEEILLNTSGTQDVDNPVAKFKLDLKVDINREKAALLGISLKAIDQTVRTALVGAEIGRYRTEQGDEFPLVLRLAQYEQPLIETFEEIYVSSNRGQLIPLLQVAQLSLDTSIARFQHYDMARMARVTSDVQSGFTTEAVTNAVIEQLEQYDWPLGMRYIIGGDQENRKEAFGGMAKAGLVTILGIFAILVLQFRSFVQPLIVFAAIPFAIIGAILALFFSGYTFSFTAFIGLVSLIGIVVNNSIILVDYANQMRREENMEKIAAIMSAAQTRFVPIVLTTLTTIGGLLPLTLTASKMWSPMGWAIIGGLLVSTLLTLIIVPVLYKLLGKLPEEVDV